MPGAQESRDAVCTHEAYLQTRSTPTTRLEWRQGRGAADRNGTELEAIGQIPLLCAANASNMRGVSVDGGSLSVFPEGKAKPTIKNSKNGPSRAIRPTLATESPTKQTSTDATGGGGPAGIVTVDYRWAQGRNDRLPSLTGELVQQGVALIRDREASLELQTHRSQLKRLVSGLHLSHGRNKKWTEKPI
jgi:hypothetical protein